VVTADGATQIGPLLVGYDGREESVRALDRALEEAAAQNAPIVVLVVAALGYETVDPYDPMMMGAAPMLPMGPDGPLVAQAALADARKRLRDAGVQGTVEWTLGDPASEIVRVAGEQHASAIIVGSHHHSALGRLFGTDTAADVMRYAPCDVIVAQ
jgi:nucleotide-binding universal stress UspA family protein